MSTRMSSAPSISRVKMSEQPSLQKRLHPFPSQGTRQVRHHHLDCANKVGNARTLPRQPNQQKRTPMSHHLDSPIARQDIRLDITDLYVFGGETGTVFAINVCHSIFGPIPAPGYHPEG